MDMHSPLSTSPHPTPLFARGVSSPHLLNAARIEAMHYSEVNRLVEQIRLVNLSDTWSVLSREAFTRRRAKDGQVRWRRSVSRQYVQAWRVLAACCRAALEVRLELEQRRMAAGFLRWRHGVVRELMLNSKRARERLAAAHSRLQQGWARWWSMATLVHLRHERRCGAGVTYALLLEHAAMRRFARAWRARTVAAWRRRDEELAVIRKWQRIGLSKRRMAVWRVAAHMRSACAWSEGSRAPKTQAPVARLETLGRDPSACTPAG
jgi:hypothetical protein